MKQLARLIVAKKLGYQVRRLKKKNNFKVVAVVGSIGKTSTKLAIAKVLSAKYKVRFQDGNYNDLITVPLIFFGEPEPSLYNPLSWLAVFRRNQRQISKPYPYDVVVIELGTDGPGQIAQFKSYLNIDVAVVTAITPEHMENFSNLEAVADEELSLADFSDKLIYNSDLCDHKYFSNIKNKKIAYGAGGKASPLEYTKLAAKTVATELGLDVKTIDEALETIKPAAGRMQELAGLNGSMILDDSYNASPAAMKLALDVLYSSKAINKIALLGNMNEMGHMAESLHKEIGEYCDPKKLDLVVTLGPEANKYLAPTAEAKGCKVKAFDSPYKAGEFIKTLLTKDTVVLVKGSQNRVFAEEAIKSLLANPADAKKLVRQSADWMKTKHKAFNR